jgi:hypothetical protein
LRRGRKLGAHHGLEGEADDSGMNVDAGEEAEVDVDRGAHGAVEEANDASGSFRLIPRARM